MHHPQREQHLNNRVGWLRAAVLGANDGLISTSSLMVGIASTAAGASQVLLTGLAGLVAGALAMAAGEYVSVSSQADAEAADIARETRELAEMPAHELAELTQIYVDRGLTPELAAQVAEQMTAKDALAAHLRDELGMSEHSAARPIEAAFTSAFTFSVGAALPVLTAILTPKSAAVWWISGVSLIGLAVLGALGGWAGGSPVLKPTLRVTFWGALAMAVTAGIGHLVGAAV